MKKQITLASLGLFSAALILTSYSSGPGSLSTAATSAPGEVNCSNCHGGSSVNSGSGSIGIIIDGGSTTYTPGMSHMVTVTGTGSSISKYGFQATALVDADHSAAGSFTADNGTNALTVGARNYIEHSSPSSSGVWQFLWQAPATDVGSITFYIAGNSAENPPGNQGDLIYTSTLVLNPAATTSVGSIDQQSAEINVYPNPGKDLVNISFYTTTAQTLSVAIFDLSGKLVKQVAVGTLYEAGVNVVSANVSDLAEGSYVVKVSGAQYAQSGTLVITE